MDTKIKIKTYVTYFIPIDVITEFRKICFREGYHISNQVKKMMEKYNKENKEEMIKEK